MAECSNEGSSSGTHPGGSSDVVELKIKTLDSQVFSFEVEKNILVSSFKEKIANDVGVPVFQQRLIYRGKVLKDDHPLSEYLDHMLAASDIFLRVAALPSLGTENVENGCTLHLVERQPSQPQSSADTSAGGTNSIHSSGGSDANAGVARNRVGQISHSVVLGTFNVGDQGESVPDLSRVIGAVLSSFGVGGQPLSNGNIGLQSSMLAPQGTEGNGIPRTASSQNQGGNQAESAQSTSSQSFQFPPQVTSTPPTAPAIPMPSFALPIPDSLYTLGEFMNNLERSLSQYGYLQDTSAAGAGDLPRVSLPSNSRGFATPEALSIVLRQAEQLLIGHAVAALSHIAGRLEQERESSDQSIRGQIQTEAVQVGRAMQHFGALLLELGRSILTLRMGQSPLESAVHSGPAVYISPTGPNPLMVQPFPLQATSLFSGPSGLSNPVTLGPVGTGGVPRHINIHIHAGTALGSVASAVGNRTNIGEGTQGERNSNAGPGSVRVLPLRNVIATSVPALRSTLQSTGQPTAGVPASQASTGTLSSSSISEDSSQSRNFVENIGGGNLAASGNAQVLDNPNCTGSVSAEGTGLQSSGATPEIEAHKKSEASKAKISENVDGAAMHSAGGSGSFGESTLMSQETCGGVVRSSEERAQSVPLGLGQGGLDFKKRTKAKSVGKSDSGPTTSVSNQNSDGRASEEKLLQALPSQSSAVVRITEQNNASSGPVVGSGRTPISEECDQFDTSAAVSQALQSPALDGLLSGVSQQTGVGSPDMLRNMLQQLTQSPQIMNTVNQIAQQVDGQGIGSMFSELGGTQGGGFNLAQMVQQMMPVVSQALGRGLSTSTPDVLTASDERGPCRSEELNNENFQIDIQEVAQDVENFSSPEDVFPVVLENAVRLLGNERNAQDLLELICSESLASEYSRILQHDIQQRMQDSS